MTNKKEENGMANLTYWQLVSLCFWFFLAKTIMGIVFNAGYLIISMINNMIVSGV